MRTRQSGTTTIEFAIIGSLLFMVIIGIVEIGRALFVWNTVAEVTRRGARVAAVCPPNHAGVARTAIFDDPGGSGDSPVLNNLSVANIQVDYLDANGVNTGGAFPIDYVRVSVVNYQHTLLIPLLPVTLNVPAFATTLPAESLGYIPELGARQCFGS